MMALWLEALPRLTWASTLGQLCSSRRIIGGMCDVVSRVGTIFVIKSRL